MKIKKKSILIIFLLFTLIFISGCLTTMIKNVKSTDYVGKKVSVTGTVQNTIKLGDFSGYTIEDKTDSIRVSSEILPKEGSRIRVSGTLMKDSIFGYYIKAD
jgi:hypothetical protein